MDEVRGAKKAHILDQLDQLNFDLDSKTVQLTKIRSRNSAYIAVNRSDGEGESKLLKISTDGTLHPVTLSSVTEVSYTQEKGKWVKNSSDKMTILAVRAAAEYVKNQSNQPVEGIFEVCPVYDKGTKDTGVFVLIFYKENEKETGQITFTPFAPTSISFNLLSDTLGSSFKKVTHTSPYWREVKKMTSKDEMDKVGDIFSAAKKEKEAKKV